MLTAPELLTLIKAHNILSKIKVPAKARKDTGALVKLIEGKNYVVDHDKKVIRPKQQRGKQLTLKSAEELTKPKVAPEVSKAKREAKKAEKEVDKQKELKLAKKEAVKEFKTKQKEGKKKAPRSILKDKNQSKSIEMKGEEKELVDFYGKTDKKYKEPPATKQPAKKAPVKKAPVKKEDNSKVFVVGQKYGKIEEKFKDDDKNTEKKATIIKVVKRTKKFIFFTQGKDDEPLRRSIQADDGEGEYLPYPFNINAKKDLIK